MILSILMVTLSACKSKQQLAEIPGANIKASKPVEEKPKPVVVAPKPKVVVTPEPVEVVIPTPVPTPVPQPVIIEPEITRKETFKLAEGESASNSDALNFKYHVVVGSFGIQDNAKKLQATLVSEGSKPVIVVNEQGMFRLLLASYNEYAQARSLINQINIRFKDAWVLVQLH